MTDDVSFRFRQTGGLFCGLWWRLMYHVKSGEIAKFILRAAGTYMETQLKDRVSFAMLDI